MDRWLLMVDGERFDECWANSGEEAMSVFRRKWTGHGIKGDIVRDNTRD